MSDIQLLRTTFPLDALLLLFYWSSLNAIFWGIHTYMQDTIYYFNFNFTNCALWNKVF